MEFIKVALAAADRGERFHYLLSQARRMELLHYKEIGSIHVEILAKPNEACETCAKQNGMIFEIDEAMKIMPLPHPKCTRIYEGHVEGWCRCTYLPVVADFE